MNTRRLIPETKAQAQLAAALVIGWLPTVKVCPMFRQLDAYPKERLIGDVRLLPVQVTDFYSKV